MLNSRKAALRTRWRRLEGITALSRSRSLCPILGCKVPLLVFRVALLSLLLCLATVLYCSISWSPPRAFSPPIFRFHKHLRNFCWVYSSINHELASPSMLPPASVILLLLWRIHPNTAMLGTAAVCLQPFLRTDGWTNQDGVGLRFQFTRTLAHS